jgi:hypothetical protein
MAREEEGELWLRAKMGNWNNLAAERSAADVRLLNCMRCLGSCYFRRSVGFADQSKRIRGKALIFKKPWSEIYLGMLNGAVPRDFSMDTSTLDSEAGSISDVRYGGPFREV